MKLHHIGIVVDTEDDVAFWRGQFGLRELGRGWVAAYECECVFLADDAGTRVELIRAGPGGGPRRLRPGLHHISFCTDDVRAEASRWAAAGTPMVEPEPVAGALGLLVNFLSPAATRGVRVEFVQAPSGTWPS